MRIREALSIFGSIIVGFVILSPSIIAMSRANFNALKFDSGPQSEITQCQSGQMICNLLAAEYIKLIKQGCVEPKEPIVGLLADAQSKMFAIISYCREPPTEIEIETEKNESI